MNPSILNAFANGNLVLVLGAGAAADCVFTDGSSPLLGQALAEHLSERYGLEYAGEPLPEVIQAIYTEAKPPEVQEYIRARYEFLRPGSTYKALASLPLKRIYTFNIDESLEYAYGQEGTQFLRRYDRTDFITEPDLLLKSVDLIHLNGRVGDKQNNLVFSESEITSLHGNLPEWYKQVGLEIYDNVLVFVGTRLNEPILFDAMNRVDASNHDNRSYLITPDISSVRKRSLESRGVVHLTGTLADFVDSLTSEKERRGIFSPLDVAKARNPALAQALADQTRATTQETIELLRGVAVVLATPQELPAGHGIRPFYEGYKPDWDDIYAGVPAELDHVANVIQTIHNASAAQKHFVFITGPAGSGKFTALRLAGHRLAGEGVPVFELSKNAKDPEKILQALEAIHNDIQYILLIPYASDFLINIRNIYDKSLLTNGILVTCERQNAWESRVKEHFSPDHREHVHIGMISKDDASVIIEKLKRFGPFTRLADMTPDQQLNEVYKRSRQQLLVGLLEATSGNGFAQLIAAELQRLDSQADRFVTAIACLATMHRADLPLVIATRAFAYQQFERSFEDAVSSLSGIVLQRQGSILARHPVYARHIVERILEPNEVKNALISILDAFSAFGSPVPQKVSRELGKLFKYLINYRFVLDMFNRDEVTTLSVYKHFETIFHQDGAYWLQYGLAKRAFEYHEDALKMFERSYDAYGPNTNTNFTLHALGQQHFILALEADDIRTAKHHVQEGESILRSIEPDSAFDDFYPITTLAFYDVRVALNISGVEIARVKARSYFDEISGLLKKNPQRTKMRELATQLSTFASTGHWAVDFWEKNLGAPR